MRSVLLATFAAAGMYLIVTPGRPGRFRPVGVAALLRSAADRAGLHRVEPRRVAMAVGGAAFAAATLVLALTGAPLPALTAGLAAAAVPVSAWRSSERRMRETARRQWPALLEELRVRTGAMGRPIPQALLEVGLKGPGELRPAFRAAQREWLLSTDFGRTARVLKDRLSDATADATLETLLVIHEVGGDVDRRLASLAEDRREDLRERDEARAKQAGARLARWFVVLVPIGMGLAGLGVGDGAASFRPLGAQVLVVGAFALVAACWIWSGRIMRLPDEERVFDR
ncbi:MAG: type II secretion system F family protein [Microthrixaceae bacterium]